MYRTGDLRVKRGSMQFTHARSVISEYDEPFDRIFESDF